MGTVDIRFSIDEKQQKRLQALAERLGVSADELLRAGVEKLLAEKEAVPDNDEEWRERLRSLSGLWKDRDDLDEMSAKFRQGWSDNLQQRIKRGDDCE